MKYNYNTLIFSSYFIYFRLMILNINNFTGKHNVFEQATRNTVLEQMKLVNAMSLTLTILQISKATRNITILQISKGTLC